MQASSGRLAEQRSHGVGADALLPGQLETRGRQDDRRLRMDLADVLDQRPSSLRVAACPDVVDEHVGTLVEITPASFEDRAAIPVRPATFDDVVAEAPQGVGLLAGEIEIVMYDEDASHGTPPRSASSGPSGPGIVKDWSQATRRPRGEGHPVAGHPAPGYSSDLPEREHGVRRR